jgi:hypothetical protein
MKAQNGLETRGLAERIKTTARRAADRVPLPAHYVANLAFAALLLGDFVLPDGLPIIDEALGAAGFYYYNMYLIQRTLARFRTGRAAADPAFAPKTG